MDGGAEVVGMDNRHMSQWNVALFCERSKVVCLHFTVKSLLRGANYSNMIYVVFLLPRLIFSH